MKWKPAAMKRAQKLAAELNRPNWDSYGAKPITPESVARFELFLSTLPDERVEGERPFIGPMNDGNLSIEFLDFIADHESAWAMVDGKEYEGPLAEMPREMLGRFFVLECDDG